MLEGRLNEFRLGDVFQLLAWTNKSGALTVDAGSRRGRVDFSSGQVAFAIADVRRAELGARLAHAGTLGDEALRRVVEAQQSGLGRVAEVLLDEGLDEQAVDDILREHVQDAVFTLMRTADGGFTFEPGDDQSELPGPRLDTEALIAEGARRLDEWEEVRRRIPSPDAVLAMTPNPPADGDHVTVTADQWRLLVLVDGTRSVTELVELTGQGEFASSQVLAELVEAGLLDAVDPADGDTGLGELLARRASLRELEETQLGMPSEHPEPEPTAVPGPEAGPELALVPESSSEPEPAPAVDAEPEPSPAFEAEPVPGPLFDQEPAPSFDAEPAGEPGPDAAPESDWLSEEGWRPEASWEPAPTADVAIARVPEAEGSPGSALDGEPGGLLGGDLSDWDLQPSAADEVPAAHDEPAGSVEPPMLEQPHGLHEEPPAAYEEPEGLQVPLGLHDEPHRPQEEPAGSATDPTPRASVDRVQVARELASLGFEGPPATPAPTTDEPPRRLTRDEDVTRGLLVRLMDGVRKA